MSYFVKCSVSALLASYSGFINAEEASASVGPTLNDIYEVYCHRSSDIMGHLPRLKRLSQECSSTVEIGIRDVVSTWAILQGLSESESPERIYVGIDIESPPEKALWLAALLAQNNNISFEFLLGNDMEIDIEPTDFLFIDSLHTYCHLTYELEKFSPLVKKYIALHDTSDPWGTRDDNAYHGDYSEYPAHIDRNKRGLWPAVEDFLKNHPEWELKERYLDWHGFTVLMRVK